MRILPFIILLAALPAWGEGARTCLSSERQRYFLGENVLITYSVTNTGTSPLTLDIGGDYRGAPRSLRFKVEAFDEQGEPLADPHPNPLCFGGLSTRPILKPGESFKATLALPHFRRIPRGGHYRISATHDLGWKNPPPPAWLELDFDEPSSQQASQVVAAMAALGPPTAVTLGQTTPPYADFWSLSYPVYLESLSRLRSAEALPGIGQIATPAATQVLLKLAQEAPLRLEAARQICLRLPIPAGAPPTQFGLAERKRLAETSWTPPLRQQTRELSRQLLAGTAKEISCGATLLSQLGDQRDLPLLLQKLDAHLESVSTYPRPAGPAYDLERAALAVSGSASLEGATSAQRLLILLRPHPPTSTVEKGLHDHAARVRELAVQVATQVDPSALLDPDPGVQVAAVEKLPGHEAVLQLLRKSTDEWVIRAAANSCRTRARWDCLQVLVGRLAEKERWRILYEQLVGLTLTRVSGYSCNGDPDDEQLLRLRSSWREYLALHQQELRQGMTLKTLPPSLIPSNFQFSP